MIDWKRMQQNYRGTIAKHPVSNLGISALNAVGSNALHAED
jgi:hypothetical protein